MQRHRVSIVLTGVCVILVIWPFFQYPGAIFYNRYFEAALIFNPTWMFHSYFSGWSYLQHLGYPTLTEIVYLSIQTLLVWGIHALAGTALTSKIYPALIQLWILASFLVFARKKYPELPYAISLIIALFFTVNPITAAAIHEGYSGMLVDYALFPWTLLLVDYSRRRGQPALLALVPLLYTLTSMFKFPEVAINIAALLALRGRDIFALLRSSRSAVALVVLALCANLYWALPIALNAATHRSFPIQADTQSEIAVTTHYSTLSNVVLGRVFGIFGADAGLCSGCGYYESSYFNAAMLFIAIAAFVGLIRARRWNYVAVLTVSIIFATGYHYQDSLIGIPYQILMGLPTMQIFRAANVFSFIEFFCYAVGLLHFYKALRASPLSRRWYAGAGVLAVVLAGLPVLTGSILEHGKPPAATFFVHVPAAYVPAKRALPRHSDGVTLLVPNQGFAEYAWGASIQDFLPAYVGRPSIANWYWPQPSDRTQRVLNLVTDAKTPSVDLSGAMRAMRIDSVLVHNDVAHASRVNPSRYGVSIFSRGTLSVVLPPLAPAPMFETAATALGAPAGSAAPVAGWTGDAVSDADTDQRCAAVPFGLAPAQDIRGATVFRPEFDCPKPVQITVFAQSANAAPVLFIRAGHRRISAPALIPLGTGLWQTTARIPRNATLLVRGNGVRALVFTRIGEQIPAAAKALSVHLTLNAWGSAQLAPDTHVVIVNQSSDPSWQLAVWRGGRAHFARKFVANGYANGWFVHGGSDVMLLNFAQIAFLLGCALSLVSVAAGLVVLALSSQRYGIRARLAAQD